MTGPPDLEQRVAALEELARYPLQIATFPEVLTEEKMARFREDLNATLGQPHRILPQPPPLTPEQVCHLLSECVTVVKPGETLIIRGQNWTPAQLNEIQRAMDAMHETGRIPFKALAVPGDELGVTEEPAFMNHVKTEHLDGTGLLKVRLTHQPSGITITASDRPEGIIKLRKALAAHAARQTTLQETVRRQQAKAARNATN